MKQWHFKMFKVNQINKEPGSHGKFRFVLLMTPNSAVKKLSIIVIMFRESCGVVEKNKSTIELCDDTTLFGIIREINNQIS